MQVDERLACSLDIELTSDDDTYDPERKWPQRKALCGSITAIVVGLPVGLLGLGRAYEVVQSLENGAALPRALLKLAIRPINTAEWAVIIAMQLAFLAWQIARYRLRAVLLFLPGLLAAVIMPAEMVFRSYLSSLMQCECRPILWSGWYNLAIFVGILAFSTWGFGRLGRRLLRPAPLPWLTARLAAFAWTNGGLMLGIAQLWFVYAHFGSSIFR